MPRGTWCALCACHAPDLAQHNSGRKHLSRRFWGGTVIQEVRELRISSTGPGPPRRMKPAQVPERTVQAARAARELVLPLVIRHSGVQLHQRACRAFDPEPVCEAGMALQDGAWPDERAGAARLRRHADTLLIDVEDAGPATILCVAQRLDALAVAGATARSAAERGSGAVAGALALQLSLGVARPQGEVAQIATAAALEALAAALGRWRGPDYLLTLTLTLDEALRPRRLAALVVRALETALRSAAAPLHVHLRARGCELREADADALRAAAARGWAARARAFCMGGHARLGAASGVRLLPGVLLQAICELAAARGGAPRVDVELEAEAPPPQPAPAVGGGDLAMVAALLG